MNNKNNNKTFYQITSLITLAVAGLMMVIGTKQNIVTQGQYKAPQSVTPIYDYKEITITKGDFTFDGTKNTYNEFTLGTNGEAFNYVATVDTTNASDWFRIKRASSGASPVYAFSQSTESGSELNKWHLTSLSITLAKYGTVGNTNTIKINAHDAFSYVSETNSTAVNNLVANTVTLSTTFDYNISLTTFSINPSSMIFLTSMTLGYTIDYSKC